MAPNLLRGSYSLTKRYLKTSKHACASEFNSKGELLPLQAILPHYAIFQLKNTIQSRMGDNSQDKLKRE